MKLYDKSGTFIIETTLNPLALENAIQVAELMQLAEEFQLVNKHNNLPQDPGHIEKGN